MGEEEKGPHSKDYYYHLLNVDKNATPAEIKKAYHGLALRLHPDKNPGANHEQWIEIQTAYEILIDPAKRKIYDSFGIQGLQAQAMYGNAIPPGLLAIGVTMIGLVLCTAALLLLLFVIFVAIKVDNRVQWTWSEVFIPLWVLDSAIGLFILFEWYTYCKRDKEDPAQEDVGSRPGLGAFLYLIFVAVQILADLRLEGYSISAIVVVIPLLILFGLLCLCCCLVAIVGLLSRGGTMPEYEEGPTQATPFTDNEPANTPSQHQEQQQEDEPVNVHRQAANIVSVTLDADAMD